MRVYDQIAAVVKSGGKTRRAAKMQSIKDWHPDVLEFIECKNREEKKVRTLVEQGYDPQEAYDTVLFQNANLSVRFSDDFMQAVEGDKPWTTHWVTDPSKAGPSYPAREMFTKMAQSTWCCGDPGVQYDTTINRWHTCPNSGRINASNPCSEYMFVDDSACNLASINLMKFRRDDGTFDAGAVPGGVPAWCSSPRKSSSITPAIPPRRSPPTATASGRSGWAIRTWAA